eukprot:scaffold7830_cov54-Isochrysis_galbana.AAC.1
MRARVPAADASSRIETRSATQAKALARGYGHNTLQGAPVALDSIQRVRTQYLQGAPAAVDPRQGGRITSRFKPRGPGRSAPAPRPAPHPDTSRRCGPEQ